jgi:hypothetical protein
MPTVVLYDVDSKIPNLALMKLSSYYKGLGYDVAIEKRMVRVPGDLYLASAVFHCDKSRQKVEQLLTLQKGGCGITDGVFRAPTLPLPLPTVRRNAK